MEENFLLLFRFDNPLESSVEFMKVSAIWLFPQHHIRHPYFPWKPHPLYVLCMAVNFIFFCIFSFLVSFKHDEDDSLEQVNADLYENLILLNLLLVYRFGASTTAIIADILRLMSWRTSYAIYWRRPKKLMMCPRINWSSTRTPWYVNPSAYEIRLLIIHY